MPASMLPPAALRAAQLVESFSLLCIASAADALLTTFLTRSYKENEKKMKRKEKGKRKEKERKREKKTW
jgi:hypothetical protein